MKPVASCAQLFLVLDIGVEPFEHLGQYVKHGFFSPVAVAFMGKHDHTDRGSKTLQRMKEPLGLDGECAGVVVIFAVDEKDGLVDLVGVHERRDLEIEVRSFPESPTLALESEGCQCPVVSAASGDTR